MQRLVAGRQSHVRQGFNSAGTPLPQGWHFTTDVADHLSTTIQMQDDRGESVRGILLDHVTDLAVQEDGA
jgi:hypothetical protein